MPNAAELPPKYYLTYFQYLVAFVEQQYGNLLSESEQAFIREFRQMPENAQCWYIRLANRRGRFFRLEKLSYPELPPLETQLPILEQAHLVQRLEKIPELYLNDVLSLFTKPELLHIFHFLEDELGTLKQMKRAPLLALLKQHLSVKELSDALCETSVLIKQAFETECLMLRFLFFGNLTEDMSAFVVRDVGHIKPPEHQAESFVPHFSTREEAEAKLHALLLYETYRSIRDTGTPHQLFEWFMQTAAPFVKEAPPIAQPITNRLALRIGALLEKALQPENALTVYTYTTVPPSHERQVRLYHKLGDTAQALALCHQMHTAPQNAKEHVFAKDFLSRLQGGERKKTATLHKQQAEKVQIDLDFIQQVELGALSYFQAQGYQGFFSENYVWKGLFGLLLWDEIFDASHGSVHHPLQIVPSDLFDPMFRQKRARTIASKLQLLASPEAAISFLQAQHHRYEGTVNPMVYWHPSLLEHVLLVCQKVEGHGLQRILWQMASNMKEYTKGFPDLFVWNEVGYQFVEVKSPNDQLSDLQYFWQSFFAAQGVNAKVLNVYW